MRWFDSLANRKVAFKPAKAGEVTLYSCGPTVYDHAHIGNLRTFIMDDLVRRSLRLAGFKVKAVMNITDVDDKTINRSQREHPDLKPQEALVKLTRHYEDLFMQDLEAVGVDLKLVQFTRATDNIPQMQELISAIDQAGYAYISDGSVYLDLTKFGQRYKYGELSNVDFKPQARIDEDDYDKQQARDFVLWKAARPGEPSWDFELNGQRLPGRPGWHIECSAMSSDKLGVGFDLHTGGIDLKFPHHENELAQTRAASGQSLSRHFVHHNHLLVDTAKMSKRLNNFHTLSDITKGGFDPLAFRLLCLQAHHSSELNFTLDSLKAAQTFLGELQAWADLVHQPAILTAANSAQAGRLLAEAKLALADDFDSPKFIAQLSQFADEFGPTQSLLKELDEVLGLGLSGRPDITASQKGLIQQREQKRQDQDFAAADQLRHDLAQQRIELDDTPKGTRWRRAVS